MRPYLSNPLSKIRGAAANKPHAYMIDGESYTLQQIADRIGLSKKSAMNRLKEVRAGTIKNTWLEISGKRG